MNRDHTNHLIQETSPYLLQHAHNPVDWYPWGDTALQRARIENKPILVSIGYAACHWCHVMEKESFEDEATAAIMNEHFINIKIDREERPDLDHIYMDAVQAMSGSGGWPLNVFLTPDGRPFYGGTYFPPRRAFNRPSWQEILLGVNRSFREKREEVEEHAQGLTDHLVQSNSFGLQSPEEAGSLPSNTEEAAQLLINSGDKEWGGFGNAPKFPQTFSIQFLLRFYYQQSKAPDLGEAGIALAEAARRQALLSLDKMIEGGIYDQAGGGFSRYSTDTEWLAPHFEKMLYDNALLVSVLAEAYQLTGIERYREVIDETMAFIQRELLFRGPDGLPGFQASLDADSEGEEGKFYVWEWAELRELLGEDLAVFADYYDLSPNGNWEGKNILRVKLPLAEYSDRKKILPDQLKTLLLGGLQKLMQQRGKRIRPALDDKIILGWNALMNTACSKAFEASGNESYRKLAITNMEFLWKNFHSGEGGGFYHTWKNEKAKYPAFLDDYAFLIEALIRLQEITGDFQWLERAGELTEWVSENFSEEDTGFFFYTGKNQEDIIVRKKEVYDGAVPSGNSVMATNLYRLSIYFDRRDWRERAERMLGALGKVIGRYPGSFGNWACLWQEMLKGTEEVVITGKGARNLLPELLSGYLPNRVILASEMGDNGLPILVGKKPGEEPQIWLCRNFMCLSPVGSVKALRALINNPNRPN